MAAKLTQNALKVVFSVDVTREQRMRKAIVGTLFGVLAAFGFQAAGSAVAAEIVSRPLTQQAFGALSPRPRIYEVETRRVHERQGDPRDFPEQSAGELTADDRRSVLLGTVDITVPSTRRSPTSSRNSRFSTCPFFSVADKHMTQVLRGPVLKEMDDIVAKKGIRLLGVYAAGVPTS